MKTEQKKIWNTPSANRLGSFVEVTQFTKGLGAGDAFSPLLASI